MLGGVIVYLYGVAVLNTLNPFFVTESSTEGGVKYEVQLDSFKPQHFNIINY